jgi:hypothetical protein
MRCSFTIKVRLVLRLFGEVAAAFNHDRARRDRNPFTFARRCLRRSAASFSLHLRALLFQNRLARKFDAVAVDGQHLH